LPGEFPTHDNELAPDPPIIVIGVRVQERTASLVVTLRLTVSLNPPMGPIVIDDVAGSVVRTVTVVGEVDRKKSLVPTLTSTMMS